MKKQFLYGASSFAIATLLTLENVNAANCVIPTGNAVNTGTCENAQISGADYNLGSLTNNGTINRTAGFAAVYLEFDVAGFRYYTFINNGVLTGANANGLFARAFNGLSNTLYFSNYGTITSGNTSTTVQIEANVNVPKFYNALGASISSGNGAGTGASILLRGTIDGFVNDGLIQSNNKAIYSDNNSSINSLTNTGTIKSTQTGSTNDAIWIWPAATIGTLTNTGAITNGDNTAGILNQGSITTLNNLQGVGNSSGALKIRGNLPGNYNIIINGGTYGQLSHELPATNNTMTFGVSSLTDTRTLIQGKVYSSVLSGVSTANLSNTTGKVGDRGTFTLKQNGATTWDMTTDGLWTPFIGYMNPSVSNTYAAATANRDAVSGALHQRYAVLNTVMEYDCSRFDKHSICLSFQARSTGWGDQTTGAGVFNMAYRVTDKIRAGVYLDYQAAQATPYATNSFTGGIQWGYNNPTFGGYVGWSDKPDGTGIQARVSGGYNPGKLTINRAILDYAEPGSGTAGLNAYYAYGLAGYGISVGNGVVLTPYGGLRYTDVTRNAYKENFVPGWVLFPLAYNAYYEQLITGLTGAKVQAMLTDKFGVNIALGGEFDFNRNANGYGGYSYAPGMEAWGVNHGGYWNGVRPAGIVGAFYDVNKNDRLMLNAYVGEQAWSSRTYTTLLAGYQVAF